MPTDVVMPQMGESIFEGTITRWLKKAGDAVEKDEPLFEISTDKVDAEIPSPVAGILSEIKVAEGETVQINTVVAVVEEQGTGIREQGIQKPEGSGIRDQGSSPPVAGVDVVMPQMGESIFEGTITRWLKKAGDAVEKDEPLFEISTDKVDQGLGIRDQKRPTRRPTVRRLALRFRSLLLQQLERPRPRNRKRLWLS